jgi:hypothetical protein
MFHFCDNLKCYTLDEVYIRLCYPPVKNTLHCKNRFAVFRGRNVANQILWPGIF